jgi:hypothetical protein
MIRALHPEVVAHYEALRPGGMPVPTTTPAGRSLLQRCGMAVWAETCSSVCSPPDDARPRPSLAPGLADGPGPCPSSIPLPEMVRDQLTLVLASMVVHQCGGADERPRPYRGNAVRVTAPA